MNPSLLHTTNIRELNEIPNKITSSTYEDKYPHPTQQQYPIIRRQEADHPKPNDTDQ